VIEQGKIMESGEQGKETMVSFIPKQWKVATRRTFQDGGTG